MRTAIVNFFKGMLVGVANVIPGVSGGTIAVVLGIFDQLIDAVNSLFQDFKRHMIFLLPLGLGAVVGIIAFSSLVEYALTNHSFPTSLFFIGLVVGSIPLIYRKATENPIRGSRSPIQRYWLCTLIAALVVIGISLVKSPTGLAARTDVTTSLMLQMFFGGALASMAMIIPGISGSFVLVLLGLYPVAIRYISSVKDFLLHPTDFAMLFQICRILVPLAAGVVLGIFLISKIIASLLEKARAATYFAILGLIFGSIFALFNDPLTYQSGVAGMDIAIGCVTLALGIGLSAVLGRE